MKKQKLIFTISLVFILVFNNIYAQNEILRVNENSTAQYPDGLSWGTAYKYLQDALDEAHSNSAVEEIWIADGTYYPDLGENVIDDLRTESFNIRSHLSLLGGFAGDGPNPDSRIPTDYVTYLSGDIGTLNDASDNSLHIIFCNSITGVVIDGVTIENGNADSFINNRGGAIYAINSNLSLNDCKIFNNKASSYGGGICIWSGFINIVDCDFISNQSLFLGGAVFINKAANAHIEGGTFVNNSSQDSGGAIYSTSHVLFCLEPVTIVNSEFRLNICGSLLNRQASGGAIHLLGTNSGEKILNCKFFDNESYGNGGAVSVIGKPNIINSVFANNKSFNFGGGVYVYANINYKLEDGKVLNSTFSENSAIEGEGLAVVNKKHENGNYLSITNCIIWNEGINSEVFYSNIEDVKVTFSDVRNYFNGLGNIDSPPLFLNPSQYNFQLNGNSECLNSGDNDAMGLPQFDIVGNERINCSFADMGAYEAIGRCDRIYVNCNVIGGDNDGSSWPDAYSDLQDALDNANAGTEIWVADGKYYPSEGSQSPIYYHFNIGRGILLYGGFDGVISETSLDDRDFENNITILSGDLVGIDDCKYVVRFDETISVLDGFHIVKSNSTLGGAGILLYFSKGIVNNCTIDDNYVGIYATYDCEVYLNCCTISNNSNGISNFAAGLTIYDSYLEVTSIFFKDNEGVGAGAMWLDNSTGYISNCIFSDNSATYGPGGIRVKLDKPEIKFCTFYNNISIYGGVQSITSDVNGLDVNNSIIRNSSGNPISGLVNTSFSNISYLNNTINGNFDANPHFVDPGNDDFHLKSTTAHYDNSIGGWTFDLYDCSTSINAGNPSITCKEPDGGPIVNIGAYGNTDQASHLCSSKSVNVYGSDSIDKHGDGSVSIYPNPVIDKLTIELELECESYVKIYLSDLSGKQIAFIAQDICKSGKNLFNYSVEDYDQLKYGVYLLTVETNDSFFSEKVVINK